LEENSEGRKHHASESEKLAKVVKKKKGRATYVLPKGKPERCDSGWKRKRGRSSER